MTPARPAISSLRPMLAVLDLPRSVRFYVESLGFNLCGTFGNPPVWAEVERDGVAVMLNAPPRDCIERDVGPRARDYQIFYFNTTSVDRLHEEFRARGVAVSDLRVAVYHMKEFEVKDPDGYWLWFASHSDEPPTRREEE